MVRGATVGLALLLVLACRCDCRVEASASAVRVNMPLTAACHAKLRAPARALLGSLFPSPAAARSPNLPGPWGRSNRLWLHACMLQELMHKFNHLCC